MSTDKSKKTDHEVSLTRRALIKAGWAIPVILSIGLPVGDVFVHATTGPIPNSGNGRGPNLYPGPGSGSRGRGNNSSMKPKGGLW